MPVELHRKAKILATIKGKNLNDIFIVAVKLLLKLADKGEIPEDLSRLLAEDPELLKQLEEVVKEAGT